MIWTIGKKNMVGKWSETYSSMILWLKYVLEYLRHFWIDKTRFFRIWSDAAEHPRGGITKPNTTDVPKTTGRRNALRGSPAARSGGMPFGRRPGTEIKHIFWSWIQKRSTRRAGWKVHASSSLICTAVSVAVAPQNHRFPVMGALQKFDGKIFEQKTDGISDSASLVYWIAI